MADVVEHKKFICVCFGDTNNNKVWQYTLYNDGTALTEWGRVGKKLQSKTTTHTKALSKMRDKTRLNNAPDKLYTEVKVAEGTESSSSNKVVNSSSLKSIAQKQIDIKDPTLKELVDFLVRENIHQIMAASGGSIVLAAGKVIANWTPPTDVEQFVKIVITVTEDQQAAKVDGQLYRTA